jgi:hypothetical protein
MTLLGLIFMIAILGLIVWAVTTLIPMPEQFKKAIYVISVVVLVFYVLSAFGLLGQLPNPRLN